MIRPEVTGMQFTEGERTGCTAQGVPDAEIRFLQLSFVRKKQQFEDVHEQKKQDQTIDVLNVCSAFSKEVKIEKAELLEHHQQEGRRSESTLSVMKPKDDQTSRLTTSSSPSKQHLLSPGIELLISDSKPDSNSHELPKSFSHPIGFERSSSSSDVYRYSEINGKQADFFHRYGLVKRSNSTSEFISFSAEWRPKYTIVD